MRSDPNEELPNEFSDKFPKELLIQIFEYVLVNNPQQTLFANQRWHQISQDERLWKQLYKHFIDDH